MNASFVKSMQLSALVLALSTVALPRAEAAVDGIQGTTFDLRADVGYIDTSDGNGLLIWGFQATDPIDTNMLFPAVQYPGPTLIVNQGDTVTINLENRLPVNTSIIFPGQTVVTATNSDCPGGDLTDEACAANGGNFGMVTYSFTATNAGTFLYHSGTDAALQSEMGLVGAIVVRPAAVDQAYSDPNTAFDTEYMSLVTQMDPRVHEAVQLGATSSTDPEIDLTNYKPVYWFINGRTFPDTLGPSYHPIYVSQPYSAIPRMNAGQTMLMRVLNGGRASHPWHTHGHDSIIVARNGRLLSSDGVTADRLVRDFTVQVHPGTTFDYLFEWTSENLGWDIFGTLEQGDHSCNGISLSVCLADNDPSDCYQDGAPKFDAVTGEYCPDHGKPIPVGFPQTFALGFGGFWSGSPYMGGEEALPPGEGGLNANGGFYYMWHSHHGREQVNDDLPPGGMTTMMVIEPPDVVVP